jgi:hypothetical protein
MYGIISFPGALYSQFIFSSEGNFIDKLTVAPFPVYRLLNTKYYLYCFFALITMVIMLPSFLLGIKLTEILSAFLFAVGTMYFSFFQSARYNFKSLDIKATKYYNWQGFSFMGQWFVPIFSLFISIGVIVLIYQMLGKNIALLFMSITGIAFIATNKFWLKSIARSFEKTRYRRLEYFREK